MNTLPAYAYSTARSAVFTLEFTLLNGLGLALPGERASRAVTSPRTVVEIRKELKSLLKDDSERIARGVYPAAVLTPELPVRHLTRFPKIVADGLKIYLRRRRGKTRDFSAAQRELLDETPRYYQRNFHFQTGGYLSSDSAELYEHQVEILFGGAADAMRRLMIESMRRAFGNSDGQGLTFLEIGAGTGRATRFVRLAFPRARIVAVDLSEPYLRAAERKLAGFSRIDFLRADGADLPFLDGRFDAAYSVFLFHELPLEARRQVLAESRRVLKKGGFLGLVDSLQTGDHEPFDKLLADFPVNYHEPFFANYLAHPLRELLAEAGFAVNGQTRGFLSKACTGAKP